MNREVIFNSIDNFIGKKTSTGVIDEVFFKEDNPLGLKFLGMGNSAIVLSKDNYAIKIYKRKNASYKALIVNGKPYSTNKWKKEFTNNLEHKILSDLDKVEGIPKLYKKKNNYIIMEKIEGLTIEELLEDSRIAIRCDKVDFYNSYLKYFNLDSIYRQFNRLALEIALKGYRIDDTHVNNIIINEDGKVNIVDVGGFKKDKHSRIDNLIELNEEALMYGFLVKKYLNSIDSIKSAFLKKLEKKEGIVK